MKRMKNHSIAACSSPLCDRCGRSWSLTGLCLHRQLRPSPFELETASRRHKLATMAINALRDNQKDTWKTKTKVQSTRESPRGTRRKQGATRGGTRQWDETVAQKQRAAVLRRHAAAAAAAETRGTGGISERPTLSPGNLFVPRRPCPDFTMEYACERIKVTIKANHRGRERREGEESCRYGSINVRPQPRWSGCGALAIRKIVNSVCTTTSGARSSTLLRRHVRLVNAHLQARRGRR